MRLSGILGEAQLCRFGRLVVDASPAIAAVWSDAADSSIAVVVGILGRKRHRDALPSQRFVVRAHHGLQGFVCRGVLDKRISARMAPLRPALVEEKVELGDLAKLAERLNQCVLVHRRMQIANVQTRLVQRRGGWRFCGRGR